MTAPLPTPTDVAGMRERHVEYVHWGVSICAFCGPLCPWPCDAARLLALVEPLSGTVTDLELANSRIRDRENGTHARLAAVLAECDRLDEDPGEVGPYTLVADRIRRAATGEGL